MFTKIIVLPNSRSSRSNYPLIWRLQSADSCFTHSLPRHSQITRKEYLFHSGGVPTQPAIQFLSTVADVISCNSLGSWLMSSSDPANLRAAKYETYVGTLVNSSDGSPLEYHIWIIPRSQTLSPALHWQAAQWICCACWTARQLGAHRRTGAPAEAVEALLVCAAGGQHPSPSRMQDLRTRQIYRNSHCRSLNWVRIADYGMVPAARSCCT